LKGKKLETLVEAHRENIGIWSGEKKTVGTRQKNTRKREGGKKERRFKIDPVGVMVLYLQERGSVATKGWSVALRRVRTQ